MAENAGQELVIAGYTPSAKNFDALVVGYYDGPDLIYAARTRNGFTPASRAELFRKIKPLEIELGENLVGLAIAVLEIARHESLRDHLSGHADGFQRIEGRRMRRRGAMGGRSFREGLEYGDGDSGLR